jgi:hypothetical protein
MLFRVYNTLRSNKKAADLQQTLVGQHLKVHVLDFEVVHKNGDVKIIPHAEFEEHIYTLPITRIRIVDNQDKGCTIKMMSKPRRIDIGGPYLIMIFVIFMLIASLLLFIFGEGKYNNTGFLLIGSSVLIFTILWIRLQRGYFDYIRKIKSWVSQNI